eukprot:6061798-Amphidinium_carterae.1
MSEAPSPQTEHRSPACSRSKKYDLQGDHKSPRRRALKRSHQRLQLSPIDRLRRASELGNHSPRADPEGGVVGGPPTPINPERLPRKVHSMDLRPNREGHPRSRHQPMVGEALRALGMEDH